MDKKILRYIAIVGLIMGVNVTTTNSHGMERQEFCQDVCHTETKVERATQVMIKECKLKNFTLSSKRAEAKFNIWRSRGSGTPCINTCKNDRKFLCM